MSEESGSEELLALLGDEYVQAILRATSRESLSARELSEECDVALSTIYRRAEEMLDHDLLVERTRIAEDGSHHSVYEANMDHIDIDLEEGTFDIRLRVRQTPADRFTQIWEDIRET